MSSQVAPTRPLIEEMQGLAERGRLAVDDSDILGEYLVERLRYQQSVAWLSYSDEATGRFVGARRPRQRRHLECLSRPSTAGAPAKSKSPPRPPDPDRIRRARLRPARPWLVQEAAASREMVWTSRSASTRGTRRDAALALRGRYTGQLRGVFTADFNLDQITEYLTEVNRGRSEVRSPFYAVFSRRGNAIASVSGRAV